MFGVQEVEMIGYFVSREGFKTGPSKVAKVIKARAPQFKKNLRAFLMFCPFYRRFVQGFAEVSVPLHALAVDTVRFEWN